MPHLTRNILFYLVGTIVKFAWQNNVLLCTSPLCLAIAFYLSGKKSGEALAKKKMELLCQNIGITTVNDEITKKALANSKVHDFEDGLEYYSALNSKCDFIITENQEDFYFSEIEVLGCEEFIKRL